MGKYKITFVVSSIQESNSPEDAAAYATADMADTYGVAFANDSVMHVEPLTEHPPIGLDIDEYYKLMAMEGREDR